MEKMQLPDIFLQLGQDHFDKILRSVSLGRLRTFQLFDPFKTRLHLQKLNSENLKKVTPRVWARLQEDGAKDLALDISQAVLISHMDMITTVLNDLGIPHEDGFFAKDADVSGYLTEGWQQRVWDKFKDKFPSSTLLFYINHLGWEVAKAETIFTPSA